MNLSGKRVLVVGGAGDIGRAVTDAALAAGAEVTVWDRDAAACREAAGRAGVAARALDATDEAAVTAAFEALAGEAGPPDVLVNAAGVFTHLRPFEALDLEGFLGVLHTNVVSCFLTCREAVRRAAGPLAIVNLSSALSARPVPMAAAYCASKAAIDSLTRSIAVEYAGRGIRANAVNPGPVEGRMLDRGMAEMAGALGGQPADILGRILEGIPIGRTLAPREVAALVVFLAGDEAAGITGQCINVCGGYAL
ncbi:SDR family oxidoreductase [Dissulfurirhabdus thermomarina]|uniref:SDR family oxidoreductase n=1 Tax=Dissulfurirhabdus thermomarina TaxID=1765737 RepID=A0A6N9TJG7_DISTH|nr:SDR family oxidoreductase [Dissulfurirhabdus thermomarina]NDY41401.1 SDR family oxidoreductase [Dissulfurirhabdus thermomarina]NMX23583.1 SDR family oxidoreductase [Dissulfurirhabdus thermomarina]